MTFGRQQEDPMTDTPDQTGSQTPSSGAESSPPAAPAPAKADLGKRAIALIIDGVATMVVGFIPLIGGMIATAYWLLRDGMDVEFMDHRSLGKKLMKLRPVMLDGSPVDMATSAKRNWMFALAGPPKMGVNRRVTMARQPPFYLHWRCLTCDQPRAPDDVS